MASKCIAAETPQPDIVVKGVVVDADNNPVVGAYIVEKGTSNGAMADINGQFTISVKSGSLLEITCMGYTTETLPAMEEMRIIL
ncbi:MAG: carboxypeptidase-like regulatory domain-containing protein, partial [Candidatus Cryptobacteroides sp.]